MPNVLSTPKPLTSQYKRTLQQEAPETLVSPKQSNFNSVGSYVVAKNNFNKYGHWATEAGPAPAKKVNFREQAGTPERAKRDLDISGANAMRRPQSSLIKPMQGKAKEDIRKALKRKLKM